MSESYEDIVQKCAGTRRDLDTILHPTFNELKKAFEIVFSEFGFGKGDFKRLSDMVYYQGGYPSENSPAKEAALADQVASVLKMEYMLGRTNFIEHMNERGISLEIAADLPANVKYTLSTDDEKELAEHFAGAGIQGVPDKRLDVLQVLIDRAQELQAEICQTADTIKVDAAEKVEAQFKIQKGSFVKAVSIAAVKLRSGEGKMAEKLDQYLVKLENQESAVEPLKQK
jgi:hypothetical protein